MPGAERTRPVRLPGLDRAEALRCLSTPWLPLPAAMRAGAAAEAAVLGLPAVLAMPHGAFRSRVARALHAAAHRAGPLVAVGGPRLRATRLPAGASLLVDAAALDPGGVLEVEALLDDGAAWVLLAVDPGVALPDALAARASALTLDVPPLAHRRDDLPALAAALLERFAERRACPPPALTGDALLALAARDWPGDLAELESVLGHALLAARGDAIDVAHLPVVSRPLLVPGPPVEDPDAYAARVETVVQELAHEIRNPLTVLKPYLDRLPAVMEDPEAQRRLAEVGPDAIARIDSLLEHVLDFARLGRPTRTAVPVGPILDSLVHELRDELRARDVTVHRTGGDAGVCAADREQLAFALRSLFVGVAQEVPPHEELVVDASRNGVVQLGFRTGGTTAEHLRRLTTPGGTGGLTNPRELPLSFTLARTVLERNGGTLGVQAEPDGRTSLIVRLPPAGD
jgi:signal transduction histidine kinase